MVVKFFKYLSVVFLLLVGMVGCAQTQERNPEKEKAAIAAFKDQMYDKIISYQPRPLYTVQLNKNNCRVLVLVNGIPYTQSFYKNYGESQGMYINKYIITSGMQELTFQIFPVEGEEFIALNADVDVKVRYAKDRDDGLNQQATLLTSELSDSVKRQKLPYYELKVNFEAEVPWDYREEMKEALNLKNIPNIEDKIDAKANQIRDLLVEGNSVGFLKEIEQSNLKNISQLYFTKNDALQQDLEADGWVEMTKTYGIKERKVLPIENYELVFGANNRVVMVRLKDDKGRILEVTSDDDIRDRPLILYWPKGADCLQVW